jgi:hypothetical protein
VVIVLGRLWLTFICLTIALLFFPSNTQAESKNPKGRLKQTDRNRDRIVDSKELTVPRTLNKTMLDDINGDGVISPQERRLCWRYAAYKVDTPQEVEFDENGDGQLLSGEVKEFLNYKYTLIKTHGKAKVDSPAEKEYDVNKDGMVDAKEAKVLKEDLKLLEEWSGQILLPR